ncbi:hypothetical protein SCLCIDRAFT_233129 [Scleroderma citrinum Foug A]|uniref:Uncharacterized protein n=1 Tax=Scleroderma citrinum Foug A TaxID=1036808 RepID=A0A0C3EH61_9AGAM|nr:hypothetical protein SCLCIDRAFT_233129 [Scleroderma citrinum Foug A]
MQLISDMSPLQTSSESSRLRTCREHRNLATPRITTTVADISAEEWRRRQVHRLPCKAKPGSQSAERQVKINIDEKS